MKKVVLLVLALAVAGCESRTDYGNCIGIGDDRSPALEYKLSVWNTILGFVFSETIVVPVVVLVNETFCPIGYKGK